MGNGGSAVRCAGWQADGKGRPGAQQRKVLVVRAKVHVSDLHLGFSISSTLVHNSDVVRTQ